MGAKRARGGAKGFASMDDEKKRQIASMGGHASAKGKKTANRGFASMDKDKQREISSRGGKASGHVRRQSRDEPDESGSQ